MNAALLTVGDELLIGQVVNTNAAWLGERLNSVGIDVRLAATVGDDEQAIRKELDRCFEGAQLVVVTGGLGPTHDDVTKGAVAGYFGVELEFNEREFERVRERFARRGRAMPESNRSQALVPRGFTPLPNAVGTAPGLFRHDAAADRTLVVLPGVPHEMKYLMENEVLPRLQGSGTRRVIAHRTLLTAGIGESHLQDLIGSLSGFLSADLKLAYLPSTSGVRLRITSFGSSQEEAEEKIARLEQHIRSRAERYLFGTGTETLEGVVGQMLQARGLTLSTAESCTGGHVLNRLTNVSGSSSYLIGGVVAYCNQVKMSQLGVSRETLEQEGAVSEAVARQMASGIRQRLSTGIGVSTTGVAGPTGGTADKPVGTVWIGYADSDGDFALRLKLAEDRIINKELSSTAVLDLIRRKLRGLT